MNEEYVIMPKSDYVAACDSVRKKTGKPGKIKSSELGPEIDSIPVGGSNGSVDSGNSGSNAPFCRVRITSDISNRVEVAVNLSAKTSISSRTFEG